FGVPRPPHHPRMRCDAQKLVKYPPGRVPGIWSRPLALEPVAAGGMKLRVGVGGINQHIGIDYKHYRPSMAWYRASRSAISTSAPPLRNDGRATIFSRLRCERSSRRSAVSTSSDMVRPWRAASRLSSAMTVSSILRVVFIWLYVSSIWQYGQAFLRRT